MTQLGPALASSTQDGYTLTIYKGASQEGLWPGDPERKGTMVIKSPDGREVQGGYWMDWPEADFAGTEEEYYTLPEEERAQLEANNQLAWGLKTNFIYHSTPPGERYALLQKQKGLKESGPFYHVFSGARKFDRRTAGLFFSYERESDDAVTVNLTMDNPLVIDTPAKAKALFDEVPFNTGERFHPHWWTKAVAYAKAQGHDAIDFQPGAFEGEEGFEYAASTVGEPQVVVFEPTQVSVVESEQSWDLGDGYTLVHHGYGGFKFMHGGSVVGSLMMNRGPDSPDSAVPGRLASVSDVLVYPYGAGGKDSEHRGKGLYRRALPILKQLYGGVRSSHSGATSDDAAKAWKAIGARNVLTTDDPVKYGGSWYSLEHLMADKVNALVDQLLGECDRTPPRGREPKYLQRQPVTLNITRAEAQWLWNNLSISADDGTDPEAEVVLASLEQSMDKLWPEAGDPATQRPNADEPPPMGRS